MSEVYTEYGPRPKVLYLVGSLRNPRIPELAKRLREELPGVEVFDDWFAAGPEADDFWKEYEKNRGRSYEEALEGYAAKHVFEFDRFHLNRATHVLLVLPAGKSGHMEVMYGKYGVGAKAGILLEPDFDGRYDVMYQFVDRVFRNDGDIGEWINESTPVREIITVEEAERRGLIAGRRQAKERNAVSGRLARLLSERFGGDREALKASW